MRVLFFGLVNPKSRIRLEIITDPKKYI